MDTPMRRYTDTYIHTCIHACTSFFSFYIQYTYICITGQLCMYTRYTPEAWNGCEEDILFTAFSVSWVLVALLTPVKVITRSSSTDDNLIVRSERIREFGVVGRVEYIQVTYLSLQTKNRSNHLLLEVFFLFGWGFFVLFLSGIITSRIFAVPFLQKLQDNSVLNRSDGFWHLLGSKRRQSYFNCSNIHKHTWKKKQTAFVKKQWPSTSTRRFSEFFEPLSKRYGFFRDFSEFEKKLSDPCCEFWLKVASFVLLISRCGCVSELFLCSVVARLVGSAAGLSGMASIRLLVALILWRVEVGSGFGFGHGRNWAKIHLEEWEPSEDSSY